MTNINDLMFLLVVLALSSLAGWTLHWKSKSELQAAQQRARAMSIELEKLQKERDALRSATRALTMSIKGNADTLRRATSDAKTAAQLQACFEDLRGLLLCTDGIYTQPGLVVSPWAEVICQGMLNSMLDWLHQPVVIVGQPGTEAQDEMERTRGTIRRWVEQSCKHPQVYPSEFGPKCVICRQTINTTEPESRAFRFSPDINPPKPPTNANPE